MKNILGLLVLYESPLQESETFRSLNKSLVVLNERFDVLVYDNSPSPLYDKSFFSIGNFNVHYLSDITNPGVSKAYNTGAKLALAMDKKWMLLLDQDTVFPVNAVTIYMKYSNDVVKMLGAPLLMSGNSVISPCNYRLGRGTALKTVPNVGKMKLKGLSLLNSGLIIPLSLYDSVGGYNEQIALDFSDHYFIDNVKKSMSEFCLLNIKCRHELSSSERNVRNALKRFEFYLKGAKEYSKNNNFIGISIIVFLRTIKLSFNYRSFCFLRCYCRFLVKK